MQPNPCHIFPEHQTCLCLSVHVQFHKKKLVLFLGSELELVFISIWFYLFYSMRKLKMKIRSKYFIFLPSRTKQIIFQPLAINYCSSFRKVFSSSDGTEQSWSVAFVIVLYFWSFYCNITEQFVCKQIPVTNTASYNT